MATGAGDRYWEDQALPSVLKHDLLRRYLLASALDPVWPLTWIRRP